MKSNEKQFITQLTHGTLEGIAKSAEAKKGERERKRHATVADNRRNLTRTGPK